MGSIYPVIGTRVQCLAQGPLSSAVARTVGESLTKQMCSVESLSRCLQDTPEIYKPLPKKAIAESFESHQRALTDRSQTACQTATPYLLSVLFPCFSQWSSISGAKTHWLPLPTPPFCHDGSSPVLSSSPPPPPPLSPVNNSRDFWRGEKWEKRRGASRSRAEQKKS